jgi:tRNA(Arg) A34 adenosine deaminase TadA
MRTNENQHEIFMKRAIELSRQAFAVEKSGGAFGAIIVKDNKIISEGYNQVIRHNDPTWHAEMQAIREACKKLQTPHLENCILYTSAECCPMCLSAAYWSHVDHIYYAATMKDALRYGDFQDEDFLEEIRKEPKFRRIKFTELMRPEALKVWQEFANTPRRARY